MPSAISHTKQEIPYAFLNGGGEMGELTRSFDWSKTAIGSPDTWPQSLRTALSILLNSRFPMFLFWGPDLLCFYNDAYRPSLGNNGKHPGALGKPGIEVWPEIWPTIKPLLDQVLGGGEATWSEDQLIPIYRNGQLEDVYWTFSYSPVADESGTPAGVFATCAETTEKVRTLQQLADQKDQLAFAIDVTELGTWDYDPVSHQFTGNDRLKEWFGLSAEAEIDLSLALAVIANKDRQRVIDAIATALEPGSDGRYNIDYAIEVAHQQRLVRAKGRAWFGDGGKAYRFNGTLQDITGQQQVEVEISLFRHMAENASDPFILMREDGSFAYLNQLALDAWGYTADEARHRRVPDVAPIYTEAVYAEAFARAQTGKMPRFETLHRRKDGTTYPVEINMDGFRIDGIPYMFAVARNITERKQAEDALRTSEARFRSLVEQAPVAIALFRGPQFIIELANGRVLEYWGRQRDEVMSKPLFEALPEASGQGFEELISNVYTTGKPFTARELSVTLMRAGKLERTYIDFVYDPYYDTDGQILGVLVVANEITTQVTARQQVEAAKQDLKHSNERLNLALDAGKLGSYALDLATGHMNCSIQCKLNYGQPPDAPFNFDNLLAVIVDEDRPAMEQAVATAIETRTVYLHEYRVIGADGELNWVRASGLPEYDTQGQPTAITGVTQNITAQRMVQKDLEQQVQQRTHQLEEANQDLQRSNNNLQQFAYVASHDLQEPLRKIQSFSDLLQSQYADQLGGGMDHLRRMQSAASRMSVLIKDLLTFSRISTKQETSTLIDLTAVMQIAMTDLDLAIREADATVTIGELPAVQGDQSQLTQLFMNLLSNAIKFRRAGVAPVVQVRCERVAVTNLPPAVRPGRMASAFYRIDVADNGVGFDEKYVDRIFQVFQRLHNKSQFTGTGIGLAICEKVAANHGGTITATSQPGAGAVFSVYLPV